MTSECSVRARVRLWNALKMSVRDVKRSFLMRLFLARVHVSFDKLKFSAQYKLLSVLAIWLWLTFTGLTKKWSCDSLLQTLKFAKFDLCFENYKNIRTSYNVKYILYEKKQDNNLINPGFFLLVCVSLFRSISFSQPH